MKRDQGYGPGRLVWALRWVGILLVTSCVCQPTAGEVLGTGFRTPEQTFQTFQVALCADLIDLEYRCFDVSFREANGVGSQAVYARAREELFDAQPFLKLLASAEITDRKEVADGLVELSVEVRTWLVTQRLRVLFAERAFYETHDAEGLLEDDFLATWGDAVGREGAELVLRAPMPEGVGVDELVEFRAGREWKIAGIAEAPEPASGTDGP